MLAVTSPITGDQDGLQEQDLQTQQSCSALSWNIPIIIWFSIATRRFGMGTTDVTGTSGSQLQPPPGAPVQAPHWCICIPSLVFTSYKLVFVSYHLTGAVKSWQPLQISVLPLVHGGGSSHLCSDFLPVKWMVVLFWRVAGVAKSYASTQHKQKRVNIQTCHWGQEASSTTSPTKQSWKQGLLVLQFPLCDRGVLISPWEWSNDTILCSNFSGQPCLHGSGTKLRDSSEVPESVLHMNFWNHCSIRDCWDGVLARKGNNCSVIWTRRPHRAINHDQRSEQGC